jgi:hypothetical protein
MDRIIVFEDQEAKRIDLVDRLKKKLKGIAAIKSIDGSGEQESEKTYETQLEDLLQKNAPKGALIVCDKDLSDMKPRFIGMSGTTVTTVADTLGFPLCLYARGEGEPQGEELLMRLAPWEKKRIILKYRSEEALADECAYIFRAFAEIEEGYRKLSKEDRITPAAALSRILGKPEIEDRIALYGSGEQGLLEEIMPFLKDTDSADTIKALTRRMPRILGNWLYSSILRFPGILVSEVPAASYLNIAPKDFMKINVGKLFEKAKYKGPFSGLDNWWWRDQLEDILTQSECDDGFALAKKKRLRIHQCKDSQTGERAGYYCMVTQEPVSSNNSKSGISWFPSGADLARIRLDKYKELAPWVGLY